MEKKLRERSGFFPMMQLSPPPFSQLVASGNILIMRSDGHPIIFTSQTSKQQRARRVGTESKCQRLNQQQDKMAATSWGGGDSSGRTDLESVVSCCSWSSRWSRSWEKAPKFESGEEPRSNPPGEPIRAEREETRSHDAARVWIRGRFYSQARHLYLCVSCGRGRRVRNFWQREQRHQHWGHIRDPTLSKLLMSRTRCISSPSSPSWSWWSTS